MPCYYTGSAEGDAALAASETITEITRVACELAKAVPEKRLANMSKETRRWVKEHRKVDRKQMKENAR